MRSIENTDIYFPESYTVVQCFWVQLYRVFLERPKPASPIVTKTCMWELNVL
jgi:hypothetical protein